MASTVASTTDQSREQEPASRLDRVLGGIEWVGNKLPEPFTLFLGLFLLTGVISTVMSWQGVTAQIPGSDESTPVRGLFTGEGTTWLTTTMGENYIGFPPLVTVLPIMLAVGIAERSGMLAALVRKLFGSARKWVLPYAVGVVGVTASVMADTAWVVIPPLAAMVFKAAGRHPVAGLLGGFAAVGAGYSTALVPTSLDALFAGITNVVMETIPATAATEVNVLSNYYFNVAGAVVLGLIAGFIIDRVLEPRLWRTGVTTEKVAQDEDEEHAEDDLSAELTREETRGLWITLAAMAVVTALLLVALLPAGSPWRNDGGGFLPSSPALDSIVFIVCIYFAVAGIVYGRLVGTVKGMGDLVTMMIGAIKDLGGFLVLAFILGQFVALFSWTGIGTWTAVQGAAGLEAIGLTGFSAILAFIVLASVLNLLIISGSGMWTLMASVFVPMFALLGYEPAFVQAAFRVGDSATQVITPLNPFMIVILGQLRVYEPHAGLGTLMSRMIPFVIPFWTAWVVLLALWFYVEIPLGPGAGIMIQN